MAHMAVAYRNEGSSRKSGKAALYLEEDVIISRTSCVLPGSTAPGATVQVMDIAAQAKMAKPAPIEAAAPPRPFKQGYIKLANTTVKNLGNTLDLTKRQRKDIVNLLQKPVVYRELPRLVGDSVTYKARRCSPETILQSAFGTSYHDVLEFTPLHLPTVSISSTSKQPKAAVPPKPFKQGQIKLARTTVKNLSENLNFTKKQRKSIVNLLQKPVVYVELPRLVGASIAVKAKRCSPDVILQSAFGTSYNDVLEFTPLHLPTVSISSTSKQPKAAVPPKPFKQVHNELKNVSQKFRAAIGILTRETQPRYLTSIPQLLKHLNIRKPTGLSKYAREETSGSLSNQFGGGDKVGYFYLYTLFGDEIEDRVVFDSYRGTPVYTILPIH